MSRSLDPDPFPAAVSSPRSRRLGQHQGQRVRHRRPGLGDDCPAAGGFVTLGPGSSGSPSPTGEVSEGHSIGLIGPSSCAVSCRIVRRNYHGHQIPGPRDLCTHDRIRPRRLAGTSTGSGRQPRDGNRPSPSRRRKDHASPRGQDHPAPRQEGAPPAPDRGADHNLGHTANSREEGRV